MIHARHRNRLPLPLPQPAVAHLRRSYSESRFGQMHLWTAYPSGGGFDERTTLICLHHAGGSGRWFAPMLLELGQDRSIYAPDLPGHGSSEAAHKAGVAEYAAAVGDFLDSMRLRSVDLFGHQFGAQVAVELAITRPQQVRRVMLWGVPTSAQQDRRATPLTPANGPGASDDGSAVIEEWRRLLERRGPGEPLAALAEDFGDRLRAGANGLRACGAMYDYPSLERLPLVRQQTLVLRLRDEFWEQAPRTRTLLPNGSMLDLPDYGAGFLSAAPQRFAAVAREFLDR
ncbi:MAG TPA: alpha/beta fold hydrolase [Steroidobacter sp.]|nr:alpha/beta fold hydrolase [Steroidobacter sp.]